MRPAGQQSRQQTEKPLRICESQLTVHHRSPKQADGQRAERADGSKVRLTRAGKRDASAIKTR